MTDQGLHNSWKTTRERCLHCGACTSSCVFLAKYQLEASDLSGRPDLAYHCFLCNACGRVCPVRISGRDISLAMRHEIVRSGDPAFDPKRYSFVLNEKREYRFRNYRNADAPEQTVLFPGCNFPSMFPKTNAGLVKLLRAHGIGVVYDCCGKPIEELGLGEDEARILTGMEERFRAHHIAEIVTMCPNCFYFLKDRLSIRVKSVYEKLREPGILEQLPGYGHEKPLRVFLPCPDRDSQSWYEDISFLLGRRPDIIEGTSCCGLGGMAGALEPELAAELTAAAIERGTGVNEKTPSGEQDVPDAILGTYCASCSGQFGRGGAANVRHVLSLLLGIEEKPTTRTSYLHRVATKFK